MRVFAIDTAMRSCGVCVLDGDVVRVRRAARMSRGHAEALAPMARAALSDAALGVEDMDRIAVTVGPGTFAGVRVGLAFARALALGRDIPVVGVTTLAALAAAAPTGDAPVLVAADARRGQIYAQAFSGAETTTSFSEPFVAAPEEAAIRFAEHLPGARLIGDGARLLAAAARSSPSAIIDGDAQPDPAAVARLAAAAAPSDAPPVPLYLRPPDATPPKPSPFAPATQ